MCGACPRFRSRPFSTFRTRSLNRPGLQGLLGLVNSGKVDGVIVAKLDRLTRPIRTVREAPGRANLGPRVTGHRLGSRTSAITIRGAVSQWEREAIGERTRDALCHKRSRGRRVGSIAFGSRLAPDDEHLEPEPTEQAALTEIQCLRRNGTTLRGIAAALNLGAYRTRCGTPWRLAFWENFAPRVAEY